MFQLAKHGGSERLSVCCHEVAVSGGRAHRGRQAGVTSLETDSNFDPNFAPITEITEITPVLRRRSYLIDCEVK